jgi:hypothetical protein
MKFYTSVPAEQEEEDIYSFCTVLSAPAAKKAVHSCHGRLLIGEKGQGKKKTLRDN